MATEVGRIVARYIADTASFDRGNARVKAGLKSTASTAKSGRSTWANYGKYAVLGVGAMVVESAKSFALFDRNMNIFQANLDEHGPKVAAHMKAAREEAKKLGADSRFPAVTAAHVAESFVQLSKAGLNYKQSMDAIEPTLLLGTAGQIDFADAATISANAMNAFSLHGKKAMKSVTDDIAGAALKSTSEVGDIAEAFRYSSTAAKTLGMDVGSLTSMVGMLSSKGLAGAMGGTSMRMFLTSIQKPRSKDAANIMNDMAKKVGTGKDWKSVFFDKKGNIKSIEEISKVWKKFTAGMTRRDKGALAHTLFGVRGMNVTRVLDMGPKAIAKFHKESTKAGSANKLAAANTKGLYGAYQRLINVVQTLGLELGEALAPTLIKIAGYLSTVAEAIEQHKGSMKALAKGIVYTTVALLALKGVLILYKVAMMAARSITLLFKGAMYAVKGAAYAVRWAIVATRFIVNAFRNTMILNRIAMVLWRGAILAARAAMWLLNTAFLSSPIGWIALAVVGLILVLRHFGVGLNDITHIATVAWDKIKGAFSAAWHWIKTFFAKHWKTGLIIAITGPFAPLVLLIRSKWDTIKGFFSTAANWLRDQFKKHWQTALTLALLGPIGLVVVLIRKKWKDIKSIMWKILSWIHDLEVKIWEAGKSLGGKLIHAIIEGIKGAPGLAKAILDKIPGGSHLRGAAGKVLGLAGLRALGGPVSAGAAYVVGERGPEIFTPGASGHITPNHALGGGPSVNIEHMSVRSDEDPYIIASVLGRQLRLAQ